MLISYRKYSDPAPRRWGEEPRCIHIHKCFTDAMLNNLYPSYVHILYTEYTVFRLHYYKLSLLREGGAERMEIATEAVNTLKLSLLNLDIYLLSIQPSKQMFSLPQSSTQMINWFLYFQLDTQDPRETTTATTRVSKLWDIAGISVGYQQKLYNSTWRLLLLSFSRTLPRSSHFILGRTWNF